MTKAISTSEKSNASTANKANKANRTRPTKAVAKQEAVEATTESTPIVEAVEKVKKIRKTADQKVVELKEAIARQFNVSQEQIINFTILRLAKSSKKVNLVDFYENLIVEIVLKPETLEKF